MADHTGLPLRKRKETKMTSIQTQRTEEEGAHTRGASALSQALAKASRRISTLIVGVALPNTATRLSALLMGVCLLSTSAQAATGQATLKLKYRVFDAETIYAVATADGDLRVFNKGPGRARVRWIDPISGEVTQRVLGDEEALFTNGQLGAEVSMGTLVSIEKAGSAAFARGFATLPSAPPLVQALKSQPHNSAFLPWHRGYRLNLDGTHGPSAIDTIIMQFGETGDSSPMGFFGRGLHNNGGFSQDDGPEQMDFLKTLLGTPSIAGGVEKYDKLIEADPDNCVLLDDDCIVTDFTDSDWTHNRANQVQLGLSEDGYTMSFYEDDSLEFVIAVPPCPQFIGSLLAPFLESDAEASPPSLLGAIWKIPAAHLIREIVPDGFTELADNGDGTLDQLDQLGTTVSYLILHGPTSSD